MRFLWDYGDNAREYIRTMKYRPSRKMALLAGRLLADDMNEVFSDNCNWDAVVPMPSSPFNRRRRNFNQCEEMAREVSARFHRRIPVENLLIHTKKTPQAWLNHDARMTRINSMFDSRKEVIAGKRILLIEDVITTGATSAAAVSHLLRCGAITVDVYALARTSVWQRFRNLVFERVGRPVQVIGS